jgi:UDP-glucose 4-epimerase
MNYLVTGAAGFIGSQMVDRLLSQGHRVRGVDNLSTGRREFLSGALTHSRFRFHKTDLCTPHALEKILSRDTDWVFHFAANADVRHGLDHPGRDLEQNTQVTFHVLEAMRKKGIKKIAFSSSGSVYGEAKVIPTPEDCPFPVQTSLYGASKLAAEGLLSAYAEGYGFQTLIFRFVSILGERYTHGHVFDFVKQLKKHPDKLSVLGNGKQRKSYLYIEDCLNAIQKAVSRRWPRRAEIINLGTQEYVTVNDSIRVICRELGVRPRLRYSGGDRGWVGDNPFIYLNCSKMRRAGWTPRVSIRDAVRKTVHYLQTHPQLLSSRS